MRNKGVELQPIKSLRQVKAIIAPKKGKKTARKFVRINYGLVYKLAQIHCTIEEIAGVLEVNRTTIECRDDFRRIYNRGLQEGKKSLRRIQWALAQDNPRMAIWLGKQYLGQHDRTEIEHSVSESLLVKFKELSVDDLREKARGILDRIGRNTGGIGIPQKNESAGVFRADVIAKTI